MKDNLGDRMKQYEASTRYSLLRRTPVIVRVDGKAFHTWTKHITTEIDPSLQHGPFSQRLHNVMVIAATSAMNNMQNVQVAYTQSDEISFFLRDWDTHETQQWFNGSVQKIASVTASFVTAAFNRGVQSFESVGFPLAYFDGRAFQLPKEEVTNYFIWRQQDASRNSVNMLGRFYYSHSKMKGANVSKVQDMLMKDHQVNWNDLEPWKKRGSCIIRHKVQVPIKMTIGSDHKLEVSYAERNVLREDDKIPIFTQDRDYIEKHLQNE